MYHNRFDRPESGGFALGLKLIGEALIDSVRGLGSQTVETHWGKARAERLSRCC